MAFIGLASGSYRAPGGFPSDFYMAHLGFLYGSYREGSCRALTWLLQGSCRVPVGLLHGSHTAHILLL